jgi:methylated-DNA-protein-cysteine methyltransferase related protein
VSAGFRVRVYDVVRTIPMGSVATYGDVAGRLGSRSVARHVGWALAACDEADVPWHRVINAKGRCSGEEALQKRQIALLRDEGVAITESGRIDLKNHRWTVEHQ